MRHLLIAALALLVLGLSACRTALGPSAAPMGSASDEDASQETMCVVVGADDGHEEVTRADLSAVDLGAFEGLLWSTAQ